MRYVVKSLLLLLGILVAVGAVLYFVRYIIAPPSKLEADDVVVEPLTELVDSYHPSATDINAQTDSLASIVDRLTVFRMDSLITDDLHDEMLASVLSTQSKAFIAWSQSRFSQHVWDKADHDIMRRTAADLQAYTFADKSSRALSNSDVNAIQTGVLDVLALYDEAWKAARQTDFHNGETNIARARSFINRPYISNCDALMKALADVPEKVTRTHYWYIRNLIDRDLGYPSRYSSYYDFSDKIPDIRAEISKFSYANYGVNKYEYVNKLNDMLSNYIDNGQRYFNRNW